MLAVVAELVGELRGESAPAVDPGDSLERDLGIGSLERVELLVRLERAFGVPLGEAVLADAETPSDLAAGVAAADATPAAAAPAGGHGRAPERAAETAPARLAGRQPSGCAAPAVRTRDSTAAFGAAARPALPAEAVAGASPTWW